MSNKHFDPSLTGLQRARDHDEDHDDGNGSHPPTKEKPSPGQHHQQQPPSGPGKSGQHRAQRETNKNEEHRQLRHNRSNGQHQQRSDSHWFLDNKPELLPYSSPAQPLLPPAAARAALPKKEEEEEEKEETTTNTPDPPPQQQQQTMYLNPTHVVTSPPGTLCTCEPYRHHDVEEDGHVRCNVCLDDYRKLRPLRGATAVPMPTATAAPRMDKNSPIESKENEEAEEDSVEVAFHTCNDGNTDDIPSWGCHSDQRTDSEKEEDDDRFFLSTCAGANADYDDDDVPEDD